MSIKMRGAEEREDLLLGGMIKQIMHGKETISFTQLAVDLKFMNRTSSWRQSWKILMNEKKFVEMAEGDSVFTGECRLTHIGKHHAATPEYLEYIKELSFVPQTNEEHQARIKKRLINDKSVQIFDLLLAHGSLSRKEISTILRCNDRQHKFSYGLKDLKTRALVEADGNAGKKRIRLADSAFLSPDDRPVAVDVDASVLREGALFIISKKRSVGKNNEAKENKKIKSQESIKAEETDDESDEKERTGEVKEVSMVKSLSRSKRTLQEVEGSQKSKKKSKSIKEVTPSGLKGLSNMKGEQLGT